ncbi:MAG: T9SS type A sorting domain-containing protein, partial [Candidatus Latescibacterota bacterium]
TNVAAQIIGPYQKIIWSTGDLSAGLIGGGNQWIEKSDDFALLYEFLDSDSLDPGVYLTGDDIAEEWATLSTPSAMAFRSRFMNHLLLNGDHRAWGEQISPVVHSGLAGSQPVFDPPSSPVGPDTMVVQGACPGMQDFDVLGATGASTAEMAYHGSQDAAVLAQATANAAGSTARVVLSGFSFGNIRDDRPRFPTDRQRHFRDMVLWFENEIPEPIGIDPIVFENRLDDAYPNPFNPATTIRYSIMVRGHVSLRVYNVAGQLVRTLVDEVQVPVESGFASEWHGLNNVGQPVSSGVYFYKLTTSGFTQTKKMVLLK